MKTQNQYGEKSFVIDNIKVDEDSREVEGVFADFNFVDSDSDLLSKDCCDKSIKEHGPDSGANRKIAHLAFHDVTRPVGVLQELKVNSNNQLQFKSILGTHTEGEDALRMYKQGIIREHSIGFRYEKLTFIPVDSDKVASMDKRNDLDAINREGGYWNVTEIKLYEGSFVTFGANSNTPNYSGIKSQEDIDAELDKLYMRMDILVKALVDGTYRKNYNDLFMLEVEQIKALIKSLVTFESGKQTTHRAKSDEQSSDEVRRNYYLQKLSK